jgi:Arc/MetJ family transcription regulator
MKNGAPPMRTNIEIDDTLMAEAQKASGQATKKQTVEQALRLMIRLRRQRPDHSNDGVGGALLGMPVAPPGGNGAPTAGPCMAL